MDIIINKEKFIDIEEVLKRTSISKGNLYVKMKYNALPKPFYKNIGSLWKESEIEEYLERTRAG